MRSDRKRLPAFGRELVAAQRRGLNVPWLCISLDWNIGRAFPRVVIPSGVDVGELDLHLVRGLDCMVAHRAESVRAIDVAEAALIAGATACSVFDMAERRLTLTTAAVRAARGIGVTA